MIVNALFMIKCILEEKINKKKIKVQVIDF